MQRYRVSTQCAACLPTWSGAACSRVHTERLHAAAALGLLFSIGRPRGLIGTLREWVVPGVPGLVCLVWCAWCKARIASLPASGRVRRESRDGQMPIGLSDSVAVVSTAILDFFPAKQHTAMKAGSSTQHSATQRNTTVDYWRGSSHALHTACRLLP